MQAEEIVKVAKPGNFIEIRVSNQTAPFLRRPISIYNMEKEKGILEIIFQVRGNGTKLLAQKQEGEEIDIIGPLGNGTFQYKKYKKIAIIGGGIGIFPLYELAKNAKQSAEVSTYLGFRTKDNVILEKEFEEVSNVLCITTDDGSYAKKGYAIEFLKQDIHIQMPDCIFACGPLPMLRAVKEIALNKNIPCQISLEEKMGCGIGVCHGCAVKMLNGEQERYGHVCRQGPVFSAKEVEI